MTTRILDERHTQLRAEQRRFCRITFYGRNEEGHEVRVSETDDWTRCTVGPVSTYSGYGEQSFDSTQTYQRDALLSLLGQAFERGLAEKAREIRTVLEMPK